jgi:glutamate N-acetyltransferase / amino-acid N-acetyltransferase
MSTGQDGANPAAPGGIPASPGSPLASTRSEEAAGKDVTFFRSRWVRAPHGVEELDPAELAPGFRAAGVACGLKAGGGTDLGLVACDAPDVASAMLLTSNAAAAAPVRVCRERCAADAIAAAVVNSGNANAATGDRGYRDAVAMRDAAAAETGLEPDRVAVAETGTIGVPLDIDSVRRGIGVAAAALSARGGKDFARSILTTDRGPKRCTVRAGGVTVSAQAKGAGMTQPGFATMLCFVQTDAAVADPEAELRRAAAGSFERITVDGQQSTNDMVLLQATGAAGAPLPEGLLDAVLGQLALEIVADGEGASRVARIEVTGAADGPEADRVARAIANSPLVQAALYGRDPNWGRIAQAAGMALAGEDLAELGPDEIDAAALGSDEAEAEVAIALGRGEARAHVFFSDLTPDYVKLNSEYTT